MFRRLPDEVASQDPAAQAMLFDTEESKKVDRLGGRKHFAVFVRVDHDDSSVQQMPPKLIDVLQL